MKILATRMKKKKDPPSTLLLILPIEKKFDGKSASKNLRLYEKYRDWSLNIFFNSFIRVHLTGFGSLTKSSIFCFDPSLTTQHTQRQLPESDQRFLIQSHNMPHVNHGL